MRFSGQSADHLESLIDKYSLESVLDTIAGICYEKEDHILASYDDVALAKTWGADGDRIARILGKIRN
jgi:hypothetical protein